MTIDKVPAVIDIQSTKFQNFEYNFLITNAYGDEKKVSVLSTSLIAAKNHLEFLVGQTYKIYEL